MKKLKVEKITLKSSTLNLKQNEMKSVQIWSFRQTIAVLQTPHGIRRLIYTLTSEGWLFAHPMLL